MKTFNNCVWLQEPLTDEQKIIFWSTSKANPNPEIKY